VNLKRRRAQAEPIPASAVSNDGSPSALLVAEGVRKIYRTGEGKVVAHVGVNLADAMVFCLGIFPVFGLTLGVIGTGLEARTTHRAVPNDPSLRRPDPTT
jgi:hypothetical protein